MFEDTEKICNYSNNSGVFQVESQMTVKYFTFSRSREKFVLFDFSLTLILRLMLRRDEGSKRKGKSLQREWHWSSSLSGCALFTHVFIQGENFYFLAMKKAHIFFYLFTVWVWEQGYYMMVVNITMASHQLIRKSVDSLVNHMACWETR